MKTAQWRSGGPTSARGAHGTGSEIIIKEMIIVRSSTPGEYSANEMIEMSEKERKENELEERRMRGRRTGRVVHGGNWIKCGTLFLSVCAFFCFVSTLGLYLAPSWLLLPPSLERPTKAFEVLLKLLEKHYSWVSPLHSIKEWLTKHAKYK